MLKAFTVEIKLLKANPPVRLLTCSLPVVSGVGLTDSPSGLAAYLMEKMAMCSNSEQLDKPHGGLANLDLNDVLDTVTIMWANECVVTATRLYAESFFYPEINILQE